jgi:branched-chain amino acid transport system substrate-binding protein
MSFMHIRLTILSVAFAAFFLPGNGAFAQKRYDPGASDTEIKIGNLMPYSGPASAYGAIGKTEEAYFRKINDEGGINGRKINFISYDDGYSPPKAVEQTRKLVESDEVLLMFGPLGTPSNLAIQKYLNAKKVPHLFVASGLTKWGQPAEFPWTMGWQPSYQTEARVYAKFILQTRPDAKIGVLYQNDDFGKDLLQSFRDGLGARAASMIVLQESYDTTEPTVDSHILNLQRAGVNVFLSFTTPKFAAQSIKKAAEIGWKPLYIQSNVSASIGSVLKPAGFEYSQNIISAAYAKDASDPTWRNDPGMTRFSAFLAKYMPDANKLDGSVGYGYAAAQTMVQVLRQAGDNLTRENIMRQAASLKDFAPDTLLPGIKINTAANDFYPIEQLRLMRFKGETWELFGEVIGGELGGRSSVPAPAVADNPRPGSFAVPPSVTELKPAPAVVALQPSRPTAQQTELVAGPQATRPVNPGSALDFGRRVALVIGNSAYQNEALLPNPRRDAAAVADALRRVGFQSVALEVDLGREKLVDALRNFSRLADTADWAVVYFAGHGMEVGGTNYLLPVDAAIGSDRDVAFAAIPLDQVLNATERAQKLRLVILDACRNNPYANRMKRTMASAARSVSRGLSRVEPDAGTLVIYAAKDGETALDGVGGNSPFTTALVKNLLTPNIEVRRLFDFVRDDVMDMTKKQQTPYTYGSISGRQDFYFLR